MLQGGTQPYSKSAAMVHDLTTCIPLLHGGQATPSSDNVVTAANWKAFEQHA